MLRVPQGRKLVLGVVLAVLATVLLATRPGVIATIPLGLPILGVAAVVGLVLVCHGGMALAGRRRERRPHD
jgi:hypothetical protein